MSRVTALLNKRKAATSVSKVNKDDGSTSSTTTSPERDTSGLALERRRTRDSSFSNGNVLATSQQETVQAKAGMRRQPSSSSMVVLPETTADGTPVVYDSTSEMGHARTVSSMLDEKGSAGRRNSVHRGGIFHRGGPAVDGTVATTAGMSRATSGTAIAEEFRGTKHERETYFHPSAASAAYQPVGEGSLSLDAFVKASGSNSTLDAITPKPGHQQFLEPLDVVSSPQPSQPQLFVTGEDTAPLLMGNSHSRPPSSQYPPVFETSDVGTSSSSSDSSVVGHAASHSDGRTRGLSNPTEPSTSTLLPLTAASPGDIPRGRSSTFAAAGAAPSNRPAPSASPIRASSFSSGKPGAAARKPSHGIAGALALSGVALAAPAPGMAHPFDIARVPSANRQRTQPARKATSGSEALSSTSSQQAAQQAHQADFPAIISRSSEELTGYESPTPLSNYTPHDSPQYEDDPAFNAMVSIDALGDFDDVVHQLGAGYALASSKRNTDFHNIFPNVPDDDYLIEDYGCALQREILIQGRLYISEHRLCFQANIFGWVTTLMLNFSEIIAIEKRNTALVIPNAILIATMHSRHNFASFLSRDITYELIVSLWRNSHPVVPASAALPDTAITEDEEEDLALSNVDEIPNLDGEGSSRKKKKMGKRRFRKAKGMSAFTQGTLDSTDSLSPTGVQENESGVLRPRASLGASRLTEKAPVTHHAPTQCNCAASNGHYPTVVMDAVFPGSPEKLYNLMFTSGFMRDFLCNDMKLTDLQIGDWAPQPGRSNLLGRSYSYIKPLSAPVGPKSAKCTLTDENLHVDFDKFVVNLTTTRTPDVPSGGSFSVKTKTCLTWARNSSTRVLVTTAVEWTGKSFLKSIVDKSSIDGQKTLYVALDKSIRAYIAAHKSEFYEGAEDDSEEVHQSVGSSLGDGDGLGTSEANGGDKGGSGNAGTSSTPEPLSFISNNVPFSKPLCDFVTTLYDTLVDLLGQMSPATLACTFIIIVLVLSNLFTLSSMRRTSSKASAKRAVSANAGEVYQSVNLPGSGQQEVAAAVRGVLQEYFQVPTLAGGPVKDARAEIEDMRTLLETLEKRVQSLKASLSDLD